MSIASLKPSHDLLPVHVRIFFVFFMQVAEPFLNIGLTEQFAGRAGRKRVPGRPGGDSLGLPFQHVVDETPLLGGQVVQGVLHRQAEARFYRSAHNFRKKFSRIFWNVTQNKGGATSGLVLLGRKSVKIPSMRVCDTPPP
jgi:hypothetical protein